MDKQGFAMEFCRLLVPSQWHVNGGVIWKSNSLQLTEMVLNVSAPNTPAAYEIFPIELYFFSQDPYMNSVYSQTTKIQPPMDASRYLEQMFLPAYRGNRAGLTITKREKLPDLARDTQANYYQQIMNNPYMQALTQNVTSQFDAASITIEYQQSNNTIEETICAVCSYAGNTMITNWGPIRLYSMRCPKTAAKKYAPILQVINNSFKVNPLWEYKISQVYYQMVQQQRQMLQSIGELSRYISRTNNEISDMLMKSYQERDRIYDKVNSQWSEYIRSVDVYKDPVNNCDVEIPNNFERAWTDGSDYIFSENPDFDPNQSPGPNWTPLERMR